MADSRSQSVFISLRGAAANRKAHFQSARRTCKFAPEKFWSERAPLVFRFRTGTVCMMNKTVIEVQVREVLLTSGGCGVFMGSEEKVFIISVDESVVSELHMFV